MKDSKLIIILIAFVSAVWLGGPVGAEDLVGNMVINRVTPSQDPLLAPYETEKMVFTRLEIDEVKRVSFFHRRKIGEAIVQGDFIRYQFDTETGELVEYTEQWREGLPESVEPAITQEEAKAMAEGIVRSSRLYFISPESVVFPLEPAPENPCWVVWSRKDERLIITVIDAMTGEQLGYGVPPPYEGFSCSGPNTIGSVCSGPQWPTYSQNARAWFETMGYWTEKTDLASDAKFQSHIGSFDTRMFYEINHGGSTSFDNTCHGDVTDDEVETWIAEYPKMPFTFLATCGGMCDTGDENFSYEFRKGSSTDTVTVGYCGMDTSPCEACWWDTEPINWQDTLFYWMNEGQTVGYAFNMANTAWPDCATGNCMRFAGDMGLMVVPVLVDRCLCRSLSDCHCVGSPPEGPIVECYFTVPKGRTLTIDPGVELRFEQSERITAMGTFYGDGSTGEIRLVTAADPNRGMKFTGELRITNGGQLKMLY